MKNNLLLILMFVSVVMFNITLFGQTSPETFTSSSTWTCPQGVTQVQVECWGGGANGGGCSGAYSNGGGGGGGAYAKSIISVSAGTMYTVTVGATLTVQGTNANGTNGNPSWFESMSTVYAAGGTGGTANGAYGAGGTTAASVGTTLWAGGNGAADAAGSTNPGGGGGGGAGSGGNGGNAGISGVGGTGGTGGVIGSGSSAGGNGATGTTTAGTGTSATALGGGGAGFHTGLGGTARSGGVGYRGQVILTWSCNAPSSQASGSPTAFSATPGFTDINITNFTRGTGDNVLIVARLSSTTQVVPAAETSYTASTVFGNTTAGYYTGTGNYVVYNGAWVSGTTNVDVTGLGAGLTYIFDIYEYMNAGPCYLTPSYTPAAVTTMSCTPPAAVGSLTPANQQNYQVDLNWGAGGGTNTLIVARVGGSATAPVAGISYTSSQTYGSGQALGTGYVVYNGTGTGPITISGLALNTTYTFDCYSFNLGPPTCYASAYTGTASTTNIMTFVSSTTTQNSVSIEPASGPDEIVGLQVVVVGATSPLALTSITFNTTNSTNPTGDIIDAKIYSTGTSSTFATGTLLATITSPSGIYTINGSSTPALNSTTLSTGTNYFWIAYDIEPLPTVSLNDYVDAAITSSTIGGVAETPTSTSSGNDQILLTYCVYSSFTVPSAAKSITNVTLAGNTITLNNTPALPGSSPYQVKNYSTNIPDLTQGYTYTLMVTDGTQATNNNMNAWIDWDANGTFGDNANEFIGGTTGAAGSTQESYSFTVPIGATVGNTDLRIDFDNSGTHTTGFTTDVQGTVGTNSACTFYATNGETLDFLVNVIAACTPPTVASGSPTAFTTTAGYTDINITNFTTGSGSDVLIVAQQTGSPTAPSNSTVYTAATGSSIALTSGQALGAGYIVYNGPWTSGTTTVDVTGLGSGVSYTFYIYDYNTGPTCYAAAYTPAAVTTASCTPPTTEASSMTFPSVSNTQMNVSWTAGNGTNELVIARLTSTSAVAPVSGLSYSTANLQFNDGQSTTGTGNYVVYNGSSASQTITVTGLAVNTSYSFDVYEYSLSPNCYSGAYTSSQSTTNAMAYVSSTTTQNNTTLAPNSGPNELICLKVVTAGITSPLTLTSITFNTSGSSYAAGDILDAKIYSTGTTSTFTSPTLLATISSPNGSYTINGSSTPTLAAQTLSTGTNYFWIAYDINALPTAIQGDYVEAAVTSSTIGGVAETPTSTTSAKAEIEIDDYCTTSNGVSCCTYGLIYAVSVTGLTTLTNNISSPYNNGSNLTDFTSTIAPVDLTSPSTDAFSVTLYNLSATYNVYIWIDLNNDGLFTDANDFVGESSSVAFGSQTTTYAFTGNITIPSGVSAGLHRMRIRVVYDSGISAACDAENYGGGNDYWVNIVPTCTAPVTQASNFADIANSNDINISWTPNDGNNVLVIARTATTTAVAPLNGTIYPNVSSQFNNGQTTTGTGNYVVYNSNYGSSGNAVDVTGLTTNTNYSFDIYEYNSSTNCYIATAYTNSATAITCTPPSAVTSFSSSGTTATQTTISWSGGTGTNTLVVARVGGTATAPTGGVTYSNANTAYGTLGTGLGTGYIVYNGTGTGPITITGLTAGITYTFDCYSFNSGPPTCYGLDYMGTVQTVNPMSYTSATTTQINTTVSPGTTSQEIVGLQIVTSGNTSPLDLTSITFNTTGSTNPGTDIVQAEIYFTGNSSTFATGTLLATIPSPNGTYTINGSSSPALPSTALAAASTGTNTNYFWIAYDIQTVGGGAVQGDNVAAAVTDFQLNSAEQSPGLSSTATATRQLEFTYCTFSCTNSACGGSGSSAGFSSIGIDLSTAGSPNTTNLYNSGCAGTTYHNYSSTTYSVTQGVSYILTSTLTDLGWEEDDGYPIELTAYVDWSDDGVFTDSGDQIWSPITSLTSGSSGTATFTVPGGAVPGAHRLRVIETETQSVTPDVPNSCGVVGATTGQAYDFTLNVIAGCTAPATQATGFISTPGFTDINISWTPNSGTNLLVIARATTTSAVIPANGTAYSTVSSVFNNGQSTTGTGNYVVYNDGAGSSGNTVDVTGLGSGVSYTFDIYEYNSTGICYIASTYSNAVTTESCTPPTTQASSMSFSSVSNTSMNVTWTAGNGTNEIVIARASANSAVTPTSGISYSTANLQFNDGQSTTGTGNYVVYNGSSSSQTITVTGLTPNTSYSFDVYEYNISPNCYKTPALTSSQTTTNAMAYTSSTTTQNDNTVAPGSTSQEIVGLQVLMSGATSALSLTSITFNTTSSTSPGTDIIQAEIYSTGTSSTFGTSTLLATISNPNGTYTINGSSTPALSAQTLSTGTNYFWIAYDIQSTANGAVVGDNVSAAVTGIVVSGNSYIPTITTTATREIALTYCTPAATHCLDAGTDYGIITNVNIGTIDNNSTGCGVTSTGYGNYASGTYAVAPATLYSPSTGNSFSVTRSYDNATYYEFAIYIDLNNDGLFTDSGDEVWVDASGNTGGSVSGTITIPSGISPGNHVIRFRNIYSGTGTGLTTPSPCSTVNYGEAQDYMINIQTASTPMTYVSSTTVQASTANVALSSQGNEILQVQVVTSGSLTPLTATSITFNTDAVAVNTNIADITNANLYYTSTSSTFSTATLVGNLASIPAGSFTLSAGGQSLATGTNYFWLTYDIPYTATTGDKVAAQCNTVTLNSGAEIPTVQDPGESRTIGSISSEYCVPAATACTSGEITNFTVGTLNNSASSSQCGTTSNGYSDYTGSVSAVTLISPSTNSFTVTDAPGGLPYYFIIWLDDNNDGVFEDPSERVFSLLTSEYTSGSVSGNIVIPSGVSQGLHRMRIRWLDGNNGLLDPCATLTDGQAQDYMVNIVPPCSGTPTGGTVSSPATICSGGTTSLTLTGATDIGNITYQWQQASNIGGPYSNVSGGSGATTTTYNTPALTATTYYQVSVTCTNGNASAISSAGTVTVNQESADPNPTGSTTVCSGGNASLTLSGGGGGTGEVINWYTGSCGGTLVATGNGATVSPSTTTTYYGRYEDPAPCSFNTTCEAFTVNVNSYVTVSVSIAASENPTVSGTSVTFTATATNGGSSPSYQWKVNGINAGANSSTYSYTPLNNDAVTCILTSDAACTNGNPAPSNSIEMSVSSAYTWNGSVSGDWNNPLNWTPNTSVPGSDNDLTIPSNTTYPTLSSDASVNNLTIEPGGSVLINPTYTLTINGDLLIQSDATGCGCLAIHGNADIIGTATVQRYITGVSGYHYISSPIGNATLAQVNAVYPLVNGGFGYFDPNNPPPDAKLPNMWWMDETHSDLSIESQNGWMGWDNLSQSMGNMKGWAFIVNSGVNIGLSGEGDQLFGANGASQPQYDAILTTAPGGYSGNGGNGFSLVGNPYPCTIDWDAVDFGNVDGAAYFWKPTSEYGGSYAYYVNGVSTGVFTVSNKINVMQGFLVHVTGPEPTDNNLSFTNDIMTPDNSTLFKSNKSTAEPILKLSASKAGDSQKATGNSDGAVIYFDDNAVNGFDKHMDAYKISNTDTALPNIYIKSDNLNLSICAFDKLTNGLTIPLGFDIKNNGKYCISAGEISNFPSGTEIYLIDITSGISQDLNINPTYTFNISNTDKNRFYIKFVNTATGINNVASTEICNVYSNDKTLTVNYYNPTGHEALLSVYNTLGQLVNKAVKINNGSSELNLNVAEGNYIVKVISNDKVYTTKVYIQ